MSTPRYPPTRIEPVPKTVGSVTFDDPYDWLHRDTPESLEWQWKQDALAQAYVREWSDFEKLKEAITRVGGVATATLRNPPRLLNGKWFWSAPSERSPARTVWIGERPGEGSPLVETLDLPSGVHEAGSLVIYAFEPSPDGRYVALAVTGGGAMVGEWLIVETASGRVLDLREPATPYTGALPGWLPDGSGFYLHDRAEGGRHRLRFIAVRPDTGPRPSVIFEFIDVPENVSGLTPEVSPDGHWVIALAGPHERIAYMLGNTLTNVWRRFLPPDYEGECSGAWMNADIYIARAVGGSTPRGRIVAIPAAESMNTKAWREIEPQTEAVLRAVTVVAGRVIVCDLLHASVRFRTMEIDGSGSGAIPLESPGWSLIAAYRRFDRSEALTFDYATFTRPAALYHYDSRRHAVNTIGAIPKQLPDIHVHQRFARSLDGTRVPYFAIHRAGLNLSQPQPAILTGYGGFGSIFAPAFLAHYVPFIQAGGILLHSNLRGGGEYGRHWHESGRLACRWNAFLDLFAIAQHAIADRLTEPSKLAMTGASNGGLLAGVALVHRPDLFRAVVPVVPLFDQLEPFPPDPALDPVRAIFYEDYGDPRDPVMSKVLHSYSPYHNVQTSVSYPAVFQVFGEKDISCQPFHGRKLTARLQASTTSAHPVLLRVWKNTGHGVFDTETATTQVTEWLAFIMRELGMRLP
jgi:prolyl oligopeptidase